MSQKPNRLLARLTSYFIKTSKKPAMEYIGKVYILDNIQNDGTAQIRIGEKLWTAKGSGELMDGDQVKITGVENDILQIKLNGSLQ